LDQLECIAGRGLRSDRYFAKRHVLQREVIEEIQNRFDDPELSAAVVRRNLIAKGVDLSIWLGKEFSFQSVHFEGTQKCKPCNWLDRVISEGVHQFMKNNFRGGLHGKVLSDGILQTR
jgi:MOSC domain-containing protein YiiM